MKVVYGVITFLVLFPAVCLAQRGKGKVEGKPTTSIIPDDSCFGCIVVNAPTCILRCFPTRGKACFVCLSLNAPQCLKPCFLRGPGQTESKGFGDEHPASKQKCPIPQPTCPPSAGLRIISPFSRHAPVPTAYTCEMWCSRDNECKAWTFDQRLSVCYLFDYPGCYDTVWERNWISGIPCRFLRSEYDAMDTTANSMFSCIQTGIYYPGNNLITYYPELSAAACGRRCQKLGTVVQAWSWATADTKNPLLRFRCFCKTTQGNPVMKGYFNSGEIDCPPAPDN